MIKRYSRPEMSRIWENEGRFACWLKVELSVCEAWARLGRIPKKSLVNIKKKAAFDCARIDELEKTVKHDVIAFLTSVAEHVGPDSRFIHMGLTSSDVLDTAFALQLRDATEIIMGGITAYMGALKDKAEKYKDTPMMGRTHGIHAEPVTFGLKLAGFYEEMKRGLGRMGRARDAVSYGKLSGAVGTYSSIDPRVEAHALKKLGLECEPVATQVVARDRHAEFFSSLAILAAAVERHAIEIRHLQRTEVLEAEEPFTEGQKGSSAMPHKRNPILSENLTGLARLVRSYAGASLENIALWHERDISHSSVERVIAPDATILVDFMLSRVTGMVKDLNVYPENMRKNIEKLGGLIFSQRVMLRLVDAGLTREEAYAVTQRNAMLAWKGKGAFKTLLSKDPDVKRRIPREALDECFDLKPYLRHVDYIFKRVFK